MKDVIALMVAGKIYEGFTSAHIGRAIDRMASDFSLGVTEMWPGQATPWQITPFSPCELRIDGEVVLTGYVDAYVPGFDAQSHTVRITGRSKTQDIIDCTPDLPGGQFNGYTIEQIARAIAAPFGIDVVVKASIGAAFPDATIERHETGFQFLERLARLRSILLCDDEQGRLVLTTAGDTAATDALVQGRNILRASANLNVTQRFSVYRVKTQVGVQTATPFLRSINAPPAYDDGKTVAENYADTQAWADANDPPQTQATTVTQGIAYDHGVPRYRPKTIIAESGLDAAGAQRRADWQARHNFARATEVSIEVQGFHQADGKLWRINQLASVTAPWLHLDQQLLVASVAYEKDARRGTTTRMTLGPVDGYQPDPGQVRVRKPKGGSAAYTGIIKPIPAATGGGAP